MKPKYITGQLTQYQLTGNLGLGVLSFLIPALVPCPSFKVSESIHFLGVYILYQISYIC